MLFKRVGNRYSKELNGLTLYSQPSQTDTQQVVTLSKKESIDALAVRAYGSGNEGNFSKIAYKNADKLLAWDLSTENIDKLSIPDYSSY